jgi:hypothetical protein
MLSEKAISRIELASSGEQFETGEVGGSDRSGELPLRAVGVEVYCEATRAARIRSGSSSVYATASLSIACVSRNPIASPSPSVRRVASRSRAPRRRRGPAGCPAIRAAISLGVAGLR